MRFADLLASKRGRLTAFFFLYVTEGIPLGFTATAIATQMRRQGVGVAEVGSFVAALYLPWAWKWAAGPLVDVVGSARFGRRRMWIVLAQAMMVLTLLSGLPFDFATQVGVFTWIVIVHNVFGAIQDVAIDGLACDVLPEEERGVANGLMFGGAYVGQAIGGSGVLFLSSVVDFRLTFLFVAGAILMVTLLVALPLREPAPRPRPEAEGPPLAALGVALVAFVRDAFRAFVGSRRAFFAVVFALLPAGSYALSLTLQSNLAVELGMSDTSIGTLTLLSTILSALGCVAGGWLSDRFGRKRMLALYLFATAIPTLYVAWHLQRAGWIMPRDPTSPEAVSAEPALLQAFWVGCLVYAVFHGLMYGTRTALFMDVTTAKVAATQFTAYMAMLNVVISYTARWQGVAAERWGYPKTLVIDALAGLVSLALLPLLGRPREPARAEAPSRE